MNNDDDNDDDDNDDDDAGVPPEDQKTTETINHAIDPPDQNHPEDGPGDNSSSSNNTISMSSYLHTSSTPTMSKIERRRRERREKKRQLKQEKKQRIKQAKIQKAQQEGRDWNAEIQAQQQFVKERTKSGDRQKRLELLWKEKLQRASSTFRICIDCSYETSSSIPPPAALFKDNDVATLPPSAAKTPPTVFMNEREVASLAQQIRYCYSYNKKNTPYPHFVTVTGLMDPDLEPPDQHHHHKTSSSASSGGRLLELLKKEVGFEQWDHRGFTCTTKPFDEYYTSDDNSGGDSKDDDNSAKNDTNDISEPQDREDENEAASSRSRSETTTTTTTETETTTKSDSILSKMVYLTSDATTTLRELDDTKIYIIGGIVDRNKSKRAAINRAESLGIPTAKLPLDEFYESHPEYKRKGSTKVLAVNHVFDILLRVHRYGGNDWDRALEDVLPSRKQEKNKTTASSKVADKDKKESKSREKSD